MNQDHARAIAALMERRLGVTPAIVVSDLADASDRIVAFSRSSAPWIVAVHMVSEGVDIPRLRVGVFASNVVTELYFRQFCGRFVRTIDGVNDSDAYVFVPDDSRLRELAHGITVDVRHGLRGRDEREAELLALEAAQRAERASDAGLYEALAARTTGERVVDFGPLFNPAAFAASAVAVAEDAREGGPRERAPERRRAAADDGASGKSRCGARCTAWSSGSATGSTSSTARCTRR